MDFDAIVLSGGRGSRLGGISKSRLNRDGRTLLQIAIDSTHGARTVVVVGEGTSDLGCDVVRESPPFAGPVAAIAAGLSALAPQRSRFTLVLACDMPNAASAVNMLIETAEDAAADQGDGVIAVDAEGREQYLLALYLTDSLALRLSSMTVADASMRSLVDGLDLTRVIVPPGSSDDVDTWQDAAALGVTR